MRIEQISLANWMSYPDRWQVAGRSTMPCLRFDDEPVCLIYGRNGAGKSSIMDAIIFALFGDYSRAAKRQDIKNSDAVRTGEKTATVELIFTLGSERHKIQRLLPAGKSKAASAAYFEWNKERGDWIQSVSGIDLVNAKVTALLGMTHELFCGTVLLEQGKTTQFMDLKPSQQIQHVTELLGFQAYEDYYVKAKELANQCKQQARLLEGQLKPLADASAELVTAAEEEERQSQAAVAKLENDLEHLNQLRQEAARVQELEKQSAQVLQDIVKFEARIQQAASIRASSQIITQWVRLEPIVREVRQANTSVDQARQQQVDLDANLQAARQRRSAADVQLAKLRPEHDLANATLGQARDTLGRFEVQHREAVEHLKVVETEVDLSRKELELIGQQAKRNLSLQAWPQVSADYELHQELLAVLPQLDTVVKDLTEAERITHEIATNEESIMAAAAALTARQEALALLRRQQEKVANDSSAADNQVNLLDKQVGAAEALLKNRQQAHGKSECPMCGTSLQGEILDRFHQELHDLEQQVTQGREAVKRQKKLATALARQHKQLSEQITAEDRSIVQAESTIKNGQEEARRRLATSNQLSAEAHKRWAILRQSAQHSRSLLTAPTPECLTDARQQQTAKKASVKQRAELQTMQAEFDAAVNVLQEIQRKRAYPTGTFTVTQIADATQTVSERQAEVAQAQQDLSKAQKAERQMSDEIIRLQASFETEQTQIQHIEQEELPRVRQSLVESEVTLKNAGAHFSAQISELNWPDDQMAGLRQAAAGDAHAYDVLKQWAAKHQAIASQLSALEKAERQIDELRVQQGEIKKQIESYSQAAREIEPTEVEKQIGACQVSKSQQQVALASAQRRHWEESQRLARRLESEQQLQQLVQDENNFRRLERLLAPPGRDSDGGPLRQQITRGLLYEVAAKASGVLEDWGQSIEVVVPMDVLAFKVIDRATSNAERHFQLYSGGEKFLVALAMAISIGEVASATGHPDCLFIDEGFGLLDAENRARVVQEIVSRLVGSGRRKQVVVITHMEDIQSAFSARYHLINDGTATRLAGDEDDLS